VLPSTIRKKLGLEPGTRMLATIEDDGSLRLRPYRAISATYHGVLADLAPGASLVDDLIAERRQEAARER
jgi:bifunctional DNA-binding transcriptional regulator/antitoxin component of YhaV-PrlF toxin-antitoxin module